MIDPDEAIELIECIRWDTALLNDDTSELDPDEVLTIGDGIDQMLTEVQFA